MSLISNSVRLPTDARKTSGSAAVVLKDGYQGKVQEQEIISFAAKTLPKHSVPRMIVYYEALPRNGVGKSDKRILREELKKVWLQKGLDAKL